MKNPFKTYLLGLAISLALVALFIQPYFVGRWISGGPTRFDAPFVWCTGFLAEIVAVIIFIAVPYKVGKFFNS